MILAVKVGNCNVSRSYFVDFLRSRLRDVSLALIFFVTGRLGPLYKERSFDYAIN